LGDRGHHAVPDRPHFAGAGRRELSDGSVPDPPTDRGVLPTRGAVAPTTQETEMNEDSIGKKMTTAGAGMVGGVMGTKLHAATGAGLV
jgi:hypothetical protein